MSSLRAGAAGGLAKAGCMQCIIPVDVLIVCLSSSSLGLSVSVRKMCSEMAKIAMPRHVVHKAVGVIGSHRSRIFHGSSTEQKELGCWSRYCILFLVDASLRSSFTCSRFAVSCRMDLDTKMFIGNVQSCSSCASSLGVCPWKSCLKERMKMVTKSADGL